MLAELAAAPPVAAPAPPAPPAPSVVASPNPNPIHATSTAASVVPPPTVGAAPVFDKEPPAWMRDCGVIDVNYGADPKEGNVIYADDTCLWVRAKSMNDYISGSLSRDGKMLQVEMASVHGKNPNNPFPHVLRFELVTRAPRTQEHGAPTYHKYEPGKYKLDVKIDGSGHEDEFTLVPFNRPHSQKQVT